MKITRLLLLAIAITASFSATAGFEDFYQGRIWSVFIVDSGPHFVENDKLMLLSTTDGRVRAIPLDGMTRRAAWRANKAGLTLQKVRLNDQEYLCADNVYLHDARPHVFVFKLANDGSREMTVQYNDKDSGADCYNVPTHGGTAHLR